MVEKKKLFLLSFFIALITMLVAIVIPEFYKVPYAFYNLIRLIAFSSLIYITYYLFIHKELILAFFIAIPTLLYNPISPIFLTRNIWIGIDFIIIILLFLVFLKVNKKTNHKENIQNQDCMASQELLKLIKFSKEININYEDKHKKVKSIGVTLGGFNKHFLEKLYKKKNIHFPNTTVFELIKYLANNNIYDKDVINDLYSINDTRNRIVHDEDRIIITKDNIDFFEKLAKSSVDKAEFLFKNEFK